MGFAVNVLTIFCFQKYLSSSNHEKSSGGISDAVKVSHGLVCGDGIRHMRMRGEEKVVDIASIKNNVGVKGLSDYIHVIFLDALH